MAIILPANTLAAGGYTVDNSCRFNGDAYLHKTVGTPTNADKYTLSVWIKRSILTSFGPDNAQYIMSYDGGGNPREHIRFNDSTDTLNWYFRDSGGSATNLTTNQEFRDVSAWYHFVFVYDSGQAVAANRQTIYCNGAEITSFSSSGYVAQNTDSNLNSNVSVKIGAIGTGSPSVYSSQYLSEVVFLDGQTLAASNFGEYDEDSPTIWKPKDVSTLTFGDNGFYLDFEDSANLGNDANGGTDWTEVTLAAADQAVDTPTNNFCTWNPLDNFYKAATFSQGNCMTVGGASSKNSWITSTIALTKGKWYCEMVVPDVTTDHSNVSFGISDKVTASATQALGTLDAYQWAYRMSNGQKRNNNSSTAYGNTYALDQVVGMALNLDDNELTYYINNTVQNSGTAISITAPASTDSGHYFIALGDETDQNGTLQINFGGCSGFTVSSAQADGNGYGAFEYAPPSGFYAICTKNLAEYG